jgi:hypothetical protein
MTDLRQAAQQALEALETYKGFIDDAHIIEGQWHWLDGSDNAITALKAALEQPQHEQMRMPKAGDKVICLEDESIGEIVSLTAGGSPDIAFDDGSRGTYMLREFAELFGYATLPAAQPEQEPVVFYRCNGCGHAYEQVHPTSCDCMGAGGFDRVEYFTTPPPAAQPEQVDCPRCGHVCSQRKWVGLTDEEITEIYEMGLGVRASVETALDKIEERNT